MVSVSKRETHSQIEDLDLPIAYNKVEDNPQDASLSKNEQTTFGWIQNQIVLLFSIAIPTAITQFFNNAIYALTSSYLGLHLGASALAAFSLASLTGNLTCLSTMVGSLTASETLSPRAYGLKQYEEVGRIAIRGYVVTSLILTPTIIIVCCFTEPILVALGQDPKLSLAASQWIRIYVMGVPFVLLFRVMQRFLNSQNIVSPIAYAACVSLIFFAPVFIRLCVGHIGFLGSAVSVILFQMIEVAIAILLVRYISPYNSQTWPGFKCLVQDSLRIESMLQYLKLSAGGVTSYTEWWFWECVCFIAGSFGVVPFCVHSIAYQLVPLVYMMIVGMSMALVVRMGAMFSENVRDVKALVKLSMFLVFLLASAVSISIYKLQHFIVALFSTDESVIKGCSKIWGKLSIFIFFLFFYCINSGICRALGHQLRQGMILFVHLWMISMPLMIYLCKVKDGGLDMLWTMMPLTYFGLNISLILSYTCFTDWDEVSYGIKKSKMINTKMTLEETSPLLPNECHDVA